MDPIAIETPVEKARRLIANEEVLVSSTCWRELVGKLLQEIDGPKAGVATNDKPNAFHVGSMKFEAGQVYVDDAGNKYVVSSAVSSTASTVCRHEAFEGRCVHCNAPFVNGQAMPSATLSSDEFMLALADELFGSFLQPTGIMFPEKEFRCCACEIVVPVRDWILAPHKQGCIVARARDYLVKHKPQSVPGWPAHDDISSAVEKRSPTQNGDSK